jgi:hypothetical protein
MKIYITEDRDACISHVRAFTKEHEGMAGYEIPNSMYDDMMQVQDAFYEMQGKLDDIILSFNREAFAKHIHPMLADLKAWCFQQQEAYNEYVKGNPTRRIMAGQCRWLEYIGMDKEALYIRMDNTSKPHAPAEYAFYVHQAYQSRIRVHININDK